jgi:hypothetical protein
MNTLENQNEPVCVYCQRSQELEWMEYDEEWECLDCRLRMRSES